MPWAASSVTARLTPQCSAAGPRGARTELLPISSLAELIQPHNFSKGNLPVCLDQTQPLRASPRLPLQT